MNNHPPLMAPSAGEVQPDPQQPTFGAPKKTNNSHHHERLFSCCCGWWWSSRWRLSVVQHHHHKKKKEHNKKRAILLILILTLAAFNLVRNIHASLDLVAVIVSSSRQHQNGYDEFLSSSFWTTDSSDGSSASGADGQGQSPIVADSKNTTTTSSSTKYAYAFVLGGCDPVAKPHYRHYLYTILISTRALRREGSTADVVVFVQMSFTSTYDVLPERDQEWLNALGIKVSYLRKSPDQGFYRIILEKFRILQLTQYRRVLLLDADVMIRGKMDYIFTMSDNNKDNEAALLKENLIVAGRFEPSNAGFFMLTPHVGDWERMLDIIRRKEERSMYWDLVLGWGHAIQSSPDDYWEKADGMRGTNWSFHGAFADQGLVYHWTKYVRKSVSILIADRVEHWEKTPPTTSPGGSNAVVRLESTVMNPFEGHAKTRPCWPGSLIVSPCQPPFSDFVHFTAKSKPWLKGPPDDFSVNRTTSHDRTAKHRWYRELALLNEELGMGLNFSDWPKYQRPTFGMYPTIWEASKTFFASSPMQSLLLSNATDGEHKQQQKRAFAPYAYVFVLNFACNPAEETSKTSRTSDDSSITSSYRIQIYTILVTTRILLMDKGHKADIVVLIRTSLDDDDNIDTGDDSSSSNQFRITKREEEWFNAMNVQLRYLPRNYSCGSTTTIGNDGKDYPSSDATTMSTTAVVADALMDLIEYRRVMYVPPNVLLRKNLEYLFDLSVSGKLGEFVLVRAEAGDGGDAKRDKGNKKQNSEQDTYNSLLMATPGKRNRVGSREKDVTSPRGGVIGNVVRSNNKGWSRRHPRREGGGGVQPKAMLPLHPWLEHLHNTSISILMAPNQVEHWTISNDGRAVVGPHEQGAAVQNSNNNNDALFTKQSKKDCWPRSLVQKNVCIAPYKDYVRLDGKNNNNNKKHWWQDGLPEGLNARTSVKTPLHLWYYELLALNQELRMNIDFATWGGEETK